MDRDTATCGWLKAGHYAQHCGLAASRRPEQADELAVGDIHVEAVEAGDILIGDSSAGKANLFWDKSAGELKFRSEKNAYLKINAEGALCVAASDLYDDYDDKRGYNLVYGSIYLGGLHGYVYASNVTIKLGAKPLSTHASKVYVKAEGGANKVGLVYITASANNAAISTSLNLITDASSVRYVQVIGGFFVGTTYPGGSWVTTNGYAWIEDHLYVGSRILLGDTYNAYQTMGLTLNQGANDNEILSLKSSEVAHEITTITETDTYAFLKKYTANSPGGGLILEALNYGTNLPALDLRATQNGVITAKSTAALASIVMRGFAKSSDARIGVGANANILAIRDGSDATEFIFDGDGDFWYTGNLTPYRGTTTFVGSIFVPLTAPLTSTSWDGDSFSTSVGSQFLDMSAAFGASYPTSGVKAVLLWVMGRDSATWPTDDLWIDFGPSSTYYYAGGLQVFGGDIRNQGMLILPTDANGDLYYRVKASGTSTFDVWLRVWGYFL